MILVALTGFGDQAVFNNGIEDDSLVVQNRLGQIRFSSFQEGKHDIGIKRILVVQPLLFRGKRQNVSKNRQLCFGTKSRQGLCFQSLSKFKFHQSEISEGSSGVGMRWAERLTIDLESLLTKPLGLEVIAHVLINNRQIGKA